jgi:hypothetical protein
MDVGDAARCKDAHELLIGHFDAVLNDYPVNQILGVRQTITNPMIDRHLALYASLEQKGAGLVHLPGVSLEALDQATFVRTQLDRTLRVPAPEMQDEATVALESVRRFTALGVATGKRQHNQ